MPEPLVSILIPAYNRAALIGETLASVALQSYKHWECIVVDDGSTDATVAVVQSYCDKDARFKLYHRPENRPKGGNAARNYALEMSRGEYVNWFDSDDLMEKHFIQNKLAVFLNNAEVDFVVSKSVNFYADGRQEPIGYYGFNDSLALTADHFIQEQVHWITDDLFIKRSKIGAVRFDESLLSGQEFNFCAQLLSHNSLNGVFINSILSYRRIHLGSIQESLKQNELLAFKRKYIVAQKTFKSVYTRLTDASEVFFINRILKLATALLRNRVYPPSYLNFLYLYTKSCGLAKGTCLVCYSILLVMGMDSYRMGKIIKAS
ncbi:glycosyltransferase family 2 protein [Snuella lapsa]|uniref:Glycosyltransferase 2-like domain-containing protein n=1 Tax=Snuella lapsa TaxID=870481 RepID=A0ABP6XT08_9FLAO